MKKLNQRILLVSILISLFFVGNVMGQDEKPYEFKMLKSIKTTPVKAQNSTSTCWSFAMTSFIETEAIRKGKGVHVLSPMFTVYNAYHHKANWYLRTKKYDVGIFPNGGALNDVPDMLAIYGALPNSIYAGLEYGSEKHNHNELSRVLNAYLESVSTKRAWDSRSKTYKNKTYISPMWKKGFKSLLNTWLGTPPESFEYQNKTYTPKSFAKLLDIDPNDYVLLTSFNHFPFYTEFVVELPDNWSMEKAMNIPVDDLRFVLKNAIENGYSVGWASDLGDDLTARSGSIWSLPEKDMSKMTKEEKTAFLKTPVPQKEVTQELRQHGYDTFITTDDHAMHLVGMAMDENDNLYYYVKNSWGIQGDYEGYQFVSESFVLYKTLTIMVHKDAIPKSIRKKIKK